jgi:predicted RNA-binding protein with PIN domain
LSNVYALPVHWLVDGMNVIGSRPDGWWRDRRGAMVRLVELLDRLAADSGEKMAVVFEQPPSPPITSELVQVTHAPRAGRDAADEEIVRLLATDPDPSQIRVVTSDRRLAEQARAAGAAVESAASFRSRIEAL